VIDLGIPPRDAFECLLFKYELYGEHAVIVVVTNALVCCVM